MNQKPSVVKTRKSVPQVLTSDTVWVPYSYRGCSQHAPNEHVLKSLSLDALRVMAGLFWDLGEGGTPPSA